MSPIVKTLAIAGLGSLIVSTLTQAAVVITATQDVFGVQISITGSINTFALPPMPPMPTTMLPSGINTQGGMLVSAAVPVPMASMYDAGQISGVLGIDFLFGNGFYAPSSVSTAASYFSVQTNGSGVAMVGLDMSYVSGASLNNNLSFIGATFESLGINASAPTAVYMLGSGETITLEAAPVPEPSTYAAIAGAAMLGLVAVRRLRRRA